MTVTYTMQAAMIELKTRLADALDDDYSDIIDDVLSHCVFTEEEEDFVLENYLNSGNF